MNEVTLPWPPKTLSPNARVHWRTHAKAKKDYREACAWACKAAKLTAPEDGGYIHLWIDCYPPDKRRRDDDNIIAAFKAGRDGIADALGIDDTRFICHAVVKDQIGGMLKVRITGGPDAVQK